MLTQATFPTSASGDVIDMQIDSPIEVKTAPNPYGSRLQSLVVVNAVDGTIY